MRHLDSLARRTLSVLAGMALAVAAGCGGGGGGGGSAPITSPPPENTAATAYGEGPIDGFGSIVVGGVRWDDSAAAVSDDRGALRSRSDLRLGMMVEVDGQGLDRALGVGRALRVRFGAETVGPIASINSTAKTFVVLGQTIEVTERTVFDASLAGGFTALVPDKVVEVHGIFDATRSLTVATRIEDKTAATEYRLRGTVVNLNATAKTFGIGTELISYAGVAATALPPQLANGLVVKVRLQTAKVAGAWVATEVRGGISKPDDRPQARIEGMITAWTSAQSFEIRGIKVDASGATFPDGTAGVVLAARVEVEGALVNGILVATEVEVETKRMPEARPFELRGSLSDLNVDAKTFVLRGVTVNYAGVVNWKGGSAADLVNGRLVEVKGVLGADRTRLDARRIDFE